MAANRIQLQNALHKPYDRVLFSREVLSPVFGSGFTLNSSLIPASVSPNKSESAAIANVWVYGKIQLDDSTEITCYEVLLQPKVRIEQSKVAIQQYVRKLLTAGQAALINFVAPSNKNVWRLTLVAKDSVLTEKGVKEKTTNAKRYTFLLGPSETCKTAAERFETLSTEKEITFQTLVNAFSVEKLSKAFFDEYTLHYQNFCDYLQESNYRKSVFNITFPAGATKQDKDKASKPIRDFVKKLLGRIVFLYFVQKKGWLGASDTNYTNGLGDFIKQLFNKSGGNDTFYSNWLTILFFDTLNKERANDDFKMPDGKIVKVPFLNGGLFDKEDFDEHLLTFKSKLFHNPDFEDAILTAKSNGFARGFLDFLDAFNFTVYEDSPDDHTVAVDPEMLGHIFENLLEDNKDKGAFYTPKEIVHYMCQESLIEYLSTGLQNDYTVYRQIGKEQIELFGNETRTGQLKIIEELGEKGLDREEVAYMVKNKDISKLTQKQLHSIDRLLDNVKICDPAIGSGAFPMGLLQEIFSIKELIAYETRKEWKPAETKLNIIQNSIYGVDIEKGAVDIARLRFWLSLVVDEEKPKPLPNLDYKIVVGDSLISKFDGEIVEINWERKSSVGKADEYVKNVQRLLVEVADKQKKYFNPNNKNKKKLQTEIRNLKIELLINQLSFNKELYIGKTVQKGGFMPTAADIKHNTERELQINGFDNLITKLKNLLKNPDEPFNHFDWKLDFPEVLNPYLVNGNGGFDIVIGNPPFVFSRENISNEEKVIYKNHYSLTQFKINLYILFIEKGYKLLKNEIGVLFYITPNNWLTLDTNSDLRKFILSDTKNICILQNYANVFESASVDTVIIGFINSKTGTDLVRYLEWEDKIPVIKSINPAKYYLDSSKHIISGISLNIETDFILNIGGTELQNICDVKNGVQAYTVGEGTPICTEKMKNERVYHNSTPKDKTWVKYLDGVDVSRYSLGWSGQYIKYGRNLSRPREVDLFYGDRLLVRQIPSPLPYCINACYTNEHTINDNNSMIVKLIDNTYKLKYILGVLNSSLISKWFAVKFGKLSQKIFPQFKVKELRIFPIIKASKENQITIEKFVSYILFIKNNNNLSNNLLYSSYFEQIIDGMVYELYFPELLKKHNREIIKHLGELPEFTDSMSDEQKMKICKKVFDRLNDKEHPVRVNLFYMNSIPEIAIIEGKNENN